MNVLCLDGPCEGDVTTTAAAPGETFTILDLANEHTYQVTNTPVRPDQALIIAHHLRSTAR